MGNEFNFPFMKFLLIAIGTRGDVEPFLAIAEILSAKKHNVTCCFPEQFKGLAEDGNFNFRGLNPAFLKMLESKEGKIAMGGKAGIFAKIRAYLSLYKKSTEINKIICREQKEIIESINPDKIIFHIKAGYPIIHEVLHPGSTVLVSPIPYVVHTVKEHAHIGFKNMGSFFNILTYTLANFGLIKNTQSWCKGLYNSKTSSKAILSALKNIPTFYTISPFLFEQPTYWPSHIKVVGHHERNKTLHWKPDSTLLNFLEKNNNILFVTFGSMVNEAPEKITRLIATVITKLNVPAIINTADGGLIRVKNINNESIHFVSNIPYDWLLPHVHSMVHHGGSGTTQMAIKYGCASLIIPHIIDQFLWNELNNSKGLGPKGVAISKLNEHNFEKLLTDLIQTPSYKQEARLASKKLIEENLNDTLYSTLIS